MRESEIISKITTAQIPESYLFGQIHIDDMDSEEVDRFTSGRDSILEDDPLYQNFLKFMKSIIKEIMKDWDVFRLQIGEEGNPENLSVDPIDRKIDTLVINWLKKHTSIPKGHPLAQKISNLARINVSSYIQCFTAENVMRIYISEKGLAKNNDEIKDKIQEHKDNEERAKAEGNVGINIRRLSNEEYNDLCYLGSSIMAEVIDEDMGKEDASDSLQEDVKGQKPIRNALMHTTTLSQEAKIASDASWNNIITKIIKRLD